MIPITKWWIFYINYWKKGNVTFKLLYYFTFNFIAISDCNISNKYTCNISGNPCFLFLTANSVAEIKLNTSRYNNFSERCFTFKLDLYLLQYCWNWKSISDTTSFVWDFGFDSALSDSWGSRGQAWQRGGPPQVWGPGIANRNGAITHAFWKTF